jgi:hypothetical protein
MKDSDMEMLLIIGAVVVVGILVFTPGVGQAVPAAPAAPASPVNADMGGQDFGITDPSGSW